MNSVIDLRDFDPRFKTGLVFSIFEGLVNGQGFKIICDQEPEILKRYFKDAQIGNVLFGVNPKGPGIWEIQIAKDEEKAHAHSCCGICGGDRG